MREDPGKPTSSRRIADAQKESRRREGRRLREKREEGFSYGVLEEPRQQP